MTIQNNHRHPEIIATKKTELQSIPTLHKLTNKHHHQNPRHTQRPNEATEGEREKCGFSPNCMLRKQTRGPVVCNLNDVHWNTRILLTGKEYMLTGTVLIFKIYTAVEQSCWERLLHFDIALQTLPWEMEDISNFFEFKKRMSFCCITNKSLLSWHDAHNLHHHFWMLHPLLQHC